MIQELRRTLADVYVFQAQAQSFHWNVVGMFFKPLHCLFGEIYENTHESIDVFAEYIRTLDELAPRSLAEIYASTTIKELEYVPGSARDMIQTLLLNNDIVIASLNTLFAAADDANKQAIADYVASRLDAHEKWRWMLKAHLQG